MTMSNFKNSQPLAMRRLHSLMLVLALAAPVVLHAAEPGKVQGSMAVNDKTFKLTHVYAIEQETDTRQKFYKIVFTDVALSDKDLAIFPDGQMGLINDGKMHALKLGLDNEKAFYSVDIWDATSSTTIKEPAKFQVKTFDGKTIAGRVYLDKPYTDMGGTYMLDLKFTVPLRPETDFLP